MKKNVIILTSGLTGSSVLTGLITRAGYWPGDFTHKKKDDYDTYENEELINLNRRLFKQANYHGNYLMDFAPDVMARIASLPSEDAYTKFIEKCAQHRPWVWKDPRLGLTIRFWKKLLNLNDCKFIVLTRGFRQLWVSTVRRGQIVSYGDSKRFEKQILASAAGFLKSNQISYLSLRYEELIVQPVETIAKLNTYMEANLTLDDLKAIYHKPLYQIPGNSVLDFSKAVLKYFKNYSERMRIPAERSIADRAPLS